MIVRSSSSSSSSSGREGGGERDEEEDGEESRETVAVEAEEREESEGAGEREGDLETEAEGGWRKGFFRGEFEEEREVGLAGEELEADRFRGEARTTEGGGGGDEEVEACLTGERAVRKADDLTGEEVGVEKAGSG